ELHALFRDLAVGKQYVLRGFAAEQDVQLRVPEAERFVLVDERDADLVRKRVGESRRQLQAGEAGAKNNHLLLVHFMEDNATAHLASVRFATRANKAADRFPAAEDDGGRDALDPVAGGECLFGVDVDFCELEPARAKGDPTAMVAAADTLYERAHSRAPTGTTGRLMRGANRHGCAENAWSNARLERTTRGA